MKIQYMYSCVSVTAETVENHLKGSRPCSYKRLVSLIRKWEYPIYYNLGLAFPNPYDFQCSQTKTHYILVHSAIAYIFKKVK